MNPMFSSPQFFAAFGLLALLALAFLLRPLIGKNAASRGLQRRRQALEQLRDELDPAQYQSKLAKLDAEQHELTRSTGRSPRGLVPGLALLVPAVTLLLYLQVGSPEGLNPPRGQTAELREFLGDLTDRVKRHPRDIESWMNLGNVWKQLQQMPAAESAFRRVLFIEPDHNDARVELAETLLFQSQRRALPTESRELLETALQANPDHQKALWLSGLGAFHDGQYDRALVLWRRLQGQLPEGSNVRASVDNQINRALAAQANPDQPTLASNALPPNHPPVSGESISGGNGSAAGSSSGLPPGHPPLPADAESTQPPARETETGTPPVASGDRIEVALALAEGLQDRVRGSETVFVFARAVNGPPAPLAVKRISAADLPTTVTLSESDSMAQGLTITTFPLVQVTARITASGNVMASPGDLEGSSQPLSVAETPRVAIRIDRVVE